MRLAEIGKQCGVCSDSVVTKYGMSWSGLLNKSVKLTLPLCQIHNGLLRHRIDCLTLHLNPGHQYRLYVCPTSIRLRRCRGGYTQCILIFLLERITAPWQGDRNCVLLV